MYFGVIQQICRRSGGAAAQEYRKESKNVIFFEKKSIFLLGTRETDQKFAKQERDLPKSTLAVTLEFEIPKSVRIVRSMNRIFGESW